MKVLSVVSEIYPLVKTGGLADVAGALPMALATHGVEMVSLVPGYPGVMALASRARPVFGFDDLFGGSAQLLRARVGGLDLLVLEAPHLYDRSGNPYAGPNGEDWPDNAFRFGALCWAAARIGLGDVRSFVPDIVHCHDWQAGLTPAYLALNGGKRPGTVITIHNLAYQGKFPPDLLSALRLPPQSYQIDGVEFYGSIGFMKAGLNYADRITTVSPSYALEIRTPEFGSGLDGLLRARANVLSGIVNGIDTKVWNPQRDVRLPARFGATTLAKRAANTAALRHQFALEGGEDRILIGVVSRLVWQKGLDLLADVAPAILASGAELAILGKGEPEIERRLRAIAAANHGRAGIIIGYDEHLAHLVQAGVDALLVPSRFEPCGITQLCAMHYGAVPIVSKVGGLGDTVADTIVPEAATGFHINPVTREALESTFARVSNAWKDKAHWRRLQQNGMRKDVSWEKSAAQYASLYAGLLETRH